MDNVHTPTPTQLSDEAWTAHSHCPHILQQPNHHPDVGSEPRRAKESAVQARKAGLAQRLVNKGRLLGHLLRDLVAHVVHEGRAGRRRSEKTGKAKVKTAECCSQEIAATGPSPRRERCHTSHLLDFQVLLYREVQVPAAMLQETPSVFRPRAQARAAPASEAGHRCTWRVPNRPREGPTDQQEQSTTRWSSR